MNTRPEHSRPLTQWYDSPALRWTQALPLGNGRLAAMVRGGHPVERIDINEETCWRGRAMDRVNPNGRSTLPAIREALFAGRHGQAEALVAEAMLHPTRCRLQPYQPLATLELTLEPDADYASDSYRRELNLRNGVHRVRYRSLGRWIEWTCFVSAVDDVMVLRVCTEDWSRLRIAIRLDRAQDVRQVRSRDDAEALRIELVGQLGHDGVSIASVAWVRPLVRDGGKEIIRETAGNAAILSGEDVYGIEVHLAGATSYVAPDDLSADPIARCASTLERVRSMSFRELLDRHVVEHSGWMDRFDLQFGVSHEPDEVSASTETFDRHLAHFSAARGPAARPERLNPAPNGWPNDSHLVELTVQQCRYLLLSASRPGVATMPSNLQGKWCGSMTPAWNSDYHPNINLQMNYWLSGPCSLVECDRPLIRWLRDIVVPSGRRVARDLYGCRGWVLHHVSDIFGCCEPMDGPFGVWPMGGLWMCRHLWEHYRFTLDAAFLRTDAWPIMAEAARFALDFLVEAPANTPLAGYLVTNPSHSPENAFRAPDGTIAWMTVAATMDIQIIAQLFRDVLTAARILDAVLTRQDRDLVDEIQAAMVRLPPMRINPSNGRLLEWSEPYPEVEPGHRHIFPAYGLHPGELIHPGVPEFMSALRRLIEARLSAEYHATGWSVAWLGCLFARLGDGDQAREMLLQRLSGLTMPNGMTDAHAQPQVGDAVGFAAAVAEMLLQSHETDPEAQWADPTRPLLRPLPALPSAWPDGQVRGIGARGGLRVGLVWRDGSLRELEVDCRSGDTQPMILWPGGAGCRIDGTEGLVRMDQGLDAVFRASLHRGQKLQLTCRDEP